MNPLFMRSQGMTPPMGSTLPPLPQQGGAGGMGMLPPIPNFNPGTPPPLNPVGGEHLFYQNTDSQGAVTGPSRANPGTYQGITDGNPLYYGQTSAYTGPQGAGDTLQPTAKPTVGAIPGGSGITYRDALQFMYGPDISAYGGDRDTFLSNLMTNDTFRKDIESKWGASLDDPYDSGAGFWKTIQEHLGKIGGNRWQGRGDAGSGGGPESGVGGGAGSGGAP